MENREAFMGISVEMKESVEEVNWRQHNLREEVIIEVTTIKQATTPEEKVTELVSVCKVGNNADVQCLLCGLKGHKVTTCRKLPMAQELIKQDKQQYWNKRKGYTKKMQTITIPDINK